MDGLSAPGAASRGMPAYLSARHRAAWAAAVSATVAIAFSLGWSPHLVVSGQRATIETAVTIAALATATLLLLQFRRQRRAYPLLVLGALACAGLTDVGSSVLPLFNPGHRAALGTGVLGHASMVHAVTGAARPTAALFAALAAAGLFVFAGSMFVRWAPRASAGAGLVGGACFLFAAAHVQAIMVTTVPADWLTPGELMQLTAYALLLTAAGLDGAQIKRAEEDAMLSAQREQIARDLHDGLVQDLAVIALHGQRMEAELGASHPVTVAARRALATSRQEIVDLSASRAPSTIAALRQIADELEARFGVEITIHDRAEIARGRAADLQPTTREQFVRIAREAIVNAARHGQARHVDVILESRGRSWLLTVSDDGSGIARTQLMSPSGFGLRAMQARAQEAGAQLAAGPGASGGTVLKLSLAAPGIMGRRSGGLPRSRPRSSAPLLTPGADERPPIGPAQSAATAYRGFHA